MSADKSNIQMKLPSIRCFCSEKVHKEVCCEAAFTGVQTNMQVADT